SKHKDLAFWCHKLESAGANFKTIIGGSSLQYCEALYQQFAQSDWVGHNLSVVLEEAALLLNSVHTPMCHTQDKILQLSGVGKEWNGAKELVNRVGSVIKDINNM
ncbi:hypothetical protein DXG01_008783, partial [Tephrocybe rancida]